MKEVIYDLAYFRQDTGMLLVLGEKRKEFLTGLITNDLMPHARKEAGFLTRLGKLLAYGVFYSLQHALLIVVAEERSAFLFEYLQQKAKLMHVTVLDKSSTFSAFTVLGSRAGEFIGETFGKEQFIEQGTTVVAQHDGSYDIIASDTPSYLTPILKIGKEEQELFRITQGIPKWGVEMDENTLFPFLGLDNAVSYTKGCYVGQEIVARTKHLGNPARLLRQLVLDASLPPAQKTQIVAEGKPIGFVTSAVYSPSQRKVIALGFVQKPWYEAGTEVIVQDNKAIIRILPCQER